MNTFLESNPAIEDNMNLRIPQREGFQALKSHFQSGADSEREVGVVLPVGCGKSGLISITPFAFSSKRTLVIAPGLKIAEQLYNDVDPSHAENFYAKCRVIEDGRFPEPAPIRGNSVNISDLEDAEIVVTNIHQLQGDQNRWLQDLPSDFFDLILFDEGHHSVANSWDALKQSFPNANIVNYSATPRRADGQLMAGRVIYSFSIFRAIQEGYIKRLKAKVLNPRSLKYVRGGDGQEVEVSLDEVRRLGEEEAGFRRSIVTSNETLYTIVDASINELRSLRTSTNENRLKIIATALNQQHCIQVTEAYRARGMRADYVHSKLEGAANQKIMNKLENHELDVIIQVRKLGEGFNHVHLSVAAVFSVFGSLSPFVQFVGRIMRVIKQNSPEDPLNRGSVIYHAGSNIGRLWTDFQDFSEADQMYFEQLLSEEGLDFGDASELNVEPTDRDGPRVLDPNRVEIQAQEQVSIQEIHLLQNDDEAKRAFDLLAAKGFTPEQYREALLHRPVPTTKVRERQAMRDSLDDKIKNAAGRILKEKNINPNGRELDKKYLGKSNFVVVKSGIDKAVNKLVGRSSRERAEFSRPDLDKINEHFDAICSEVDGDL